MPINTKITLSNKELSLIENTEWILLKHQIIGKISSLFAECSHFLKNEIIPFYHFPASILNKPPKISKGENYRQLPYMVLDYPGYFDRQDIFALRTFFWWGNFISIHLHLAGKYISCIDFSSFDKQSAKVFPLYICVSETQWEHYFGEGNYVLYEQLTRNEIDKMIQQNYFMKIALKFDLSDPIKITENLEKGYRQLAEMLISYPNDKKDLSPDNPKVESGL